METNSITAEQSNLTIIAYTAKKKKRFENNQYAPLAPKTAKILAKIKNQFSKDEQKITPEKLELSKSKIRNRLGRHTADRIPLKTDTSNPFSEGLSTTKMSRKVEEYRNGLQKTLEKMQPPPQDLKGRVSKQTEC